jgi:hypothetical protein
MVFVIIIFGFLPLVAFAVILRQRWTSKEQTADHADEKPFRCFPSSLLKER